MGVVGAGKLQSRLASLPRKPARCGRRCRSDASRDRAVRWWWWAWSERESCNRDLRRSHENRRASGGVVGATQVAIGRCGGGGRGRGGKAVIATCVAPTGNRGASGSVVGATQVAIGRRETRSGRWRFCACWRNPLQFAQLGCCNAAMRNSSSGAARGMVHKVSGIFTLCSDSRSERRGAGALTSP